MATLKNYKPKLSETETMDIVLGVGRIFAADLPVDVIPHSWYKHLRRGSGLPNLPAIIILADVCYWWRPKIEEVETEEGPETRYDKKFSADRLQRNRSWYGKKKGLSKKQVTDALRFLQEKRLIFVDYEDLTVDYSDGEERLLNNRIFITPRPKQIAAITPLEPRGSRVEPLGTGGRASRNGGSSLQALPLEPLGSHTKISGAKISFPEISIAVEDRRLDITKNGASSSTSGEISLSQIGDSIPVESSEEDDSRPINGNGISDSSKRAAATPTNPVAPPPAAPLDIIRSGVDGLGRDELLDELGAAPDIFTVEVVAGPCGINLQLASDKQRRQVLDAARRLRSEAGYTRDFFLYSFERWWYEAGLGKLKGEPVNRPADVLKFWMRYTDYLDHGLLQKNRETGEVSEKRVRPPMVWEEEKRLVGQSDAGLRKELFSRRALEAFLAGQLSYREFEKADYFA